MLTDKTVLDLFRESVLKDPNKLALVFFGRKFSYGDLDARSTEFAKYLLYFNRRPGDRVAMLLPNCPQMVIAYLGILKAGSVSVALNPLAATDEIMEILRQSEPRFLFTLRDFSQHNEAISRATDLPLPIEMERVNLGDYLPALLKPLYWLKNYRKKFFVPPHYAYSWNDRRISLAASYYSKPLPAVRPDDLAVLQYTGGTTGTPKAAMLTHGNLASNTLQAILHVNGNGEVLGAGSVFLGAIPFFHVYGLSVCLNMAFALGSTVVILPRPETKPMLKAFRKYGVNAFPSIPRFYKMLVDDPDMRNGRYRDLGKTLKVCFNGAGGLDPLLKTQFEELSGSVIVEGYGLSEASPIVSVNPIKGGKPGSLGTVVPNTEIKIVDGELLVRGPQVMEGYWQRPQETAETITPDGWLKTGDIVHQDDDGFLWMDDRKKDMVKVNGENVYTQEIERWLRQCAGLNDAAVIGLPDLLTGEKVVACVVLQNGWDPERALPILQEHCQSLPSIKQPKEFRFVPEIPKSVIGKVLKRELRKQLGV